MKKVQMRVDGIMCNNCVKKITQELNKLSGVSNVSVSPDYQTVSLETKEGKISINEIKQAIEAIEGKSFQVSKQM